MKKLLIFVPRFEPAFKAGGPIRSIKALVENLSGFYDITIITKDRDIGDKKSFSSLRINKLTYKENYKIYYCTKWYLLANSVKLIKEINPDTLYLNSFFSFNFSVYISFFKRFNIISKNIKTIVAPRGEFAKSALNLKGKIGLLKKLKKKMFLFVVKIFNIHKGIIFHVTSDSEEQDIKRIYSKKHLKIFKAPNFATAYKDIMVNKKKEEEVLRIVFLSRINKIKNLNYALNILRSLKKEVLFDIYGPIEDNSYWEYCKKLIKSLPKSIIVNYKGTVDGKETVNTLNNYDILFLPTKGENFGHAIVESLAAGLIILTSDQVPQNDLSEFNCGFNGSLEDKQEFIDFIDELYHNTEQINRMKRNAREYYLNNYFNNQELKNKYLQWL